MPRYVCNNCDSEPSDGLDGLCSTCRDRLAVDLMIDEMSEDEYVAYKRSKVEHYTDAEIDRAQARLAHLLGFTEEDLLK